MSKNKTPRGCFHYRMTHKGQNYDVNHFWQPGDPVTEEDDILLKKVKDFYLQNGYSPSRSDLLQDVGRLKHRFRTWKNVLIAAGVPASNDPENQRKRQNINSPKKADTASIWTD